jgi:uncharacterized protein (DUF1330 family)
MAAYMIFTRESTTDQSELDLYCSEAGATLEGHPATVLVHYGDFQMLEGDPIEGAVVIRFPSVAEAKAFYDGFAYQKAAIHRHAGAKYRVFIVEGVN